MIAHGACGKSWSGQSRTHCPSCHETFNSDSVANRHRKGAFGVDRRCIPPAEAGLVAVECSWGVCWHRRRDDPKFNDWFKRMKEN